MENEDEKHEGSFFITIPVTVLNEEMSPSAKILFGYISSMITADGYCYASNKYLVKLMKTDLRQTQRFLEELEHHGFLVKDIPNNGQPRRLGINMKLPYQRGDDKYDMGGDKYDMGGCQNCHGVIKKENLASSLASPLSSSLNNPISNPSPNSFSLEKKEQQVTGIREGYSLDKGCGEKNTETDSGVCVETLFERFWCEYPKKVGKKDAVKAFMRIANLEDTFPKIMDALAKFKTTPEWKKENGRFIPYPATWIHGERWNDEIHEDKWVALDRELRQKHPEWYEKKEDGFDDGLI